MTGPPEPAPGLAEQVPIDEPSSLPMTEHGYLKTLCERMAYYCDHPGFDGYDVTLAELYDLLKYYLANSMLWPLGPSES